MKQTLTLPIVIASLTAHRPMPDMVKAGLNVTQHYLEPSMRIHSQMSLIDLQERMGDDATRSEAAEMRDLLVASVYCETMHVPDTEWAAMLEEAVSNA